MKQSPGGCGWCGGEVAQQRTGRPRLYCRQAHRQRAYEARRLGWRLGLDSGEAIVSSSTVERIRDQLTIVEAALEDVERDLRAAPGDEEYRAAFRHLYAATAGLRGMRLRARAFTRRGA